MSWFRFAKSKRRSAGFLRAQEGTATIEFVFCLPILMMIFMASVEAGLYMIRHVMMERGLDLVIRDFRLGRLDALGPNDIRNLVCAQTLVLPNCQNQLKVWIEPVNTATWAPPAQTAQCGDANGTLVPPSSGSVIGGKINEIMYVRVCTVMTPIFPSTGLGLRLRSDRASGGYQLASATVVVVEPH